MRNLSSISDMKFAHVQVSVGVVSVEIVRFSVLSTNLRRSPVPRDVGSFKSGKGDAKLSRELDIDLVEVATTFDESSH